MYESRQTGLNYSTGAGRQLRGVARIPQRVAHAVAEGLSHRIRGHLVRRHLLPAPAVHLSRCGHRRLEHRAIPDDGEAPVRDHDDWGNAYAAVRYFAARSDAGVSSG